MCRWLWSGSPLFRSKSARHGSTPGMPLELAGDAGRPGRGAAPSIRLRGEGGIRTPGTVARTHDFQSCTFGHSVTSPGPRRGRRGFCHTFQSSELLRRFVAGQRSKRPLEDLRREWDSNPRWAVNPHLISNQVPSATRTSLRGGTWQADRGLSRTGGQAQNPRGVREKGLGSGPPKSRNLGAHRVQHEVAARELSILRHGRGWVHAP